MICVGIDVAKDKHDCFILNSEGEVLADVFTIPNNLEGFNCLLQKIQSCFTLHDKVEVGLEATGHYGYNILGFLLDNGLPTYVLNPLHTNLYRKSLTLRKTKTVPAKSLELRHTIRLIRELDAEIKEIEKAIQNIMDDLHSPITTIPGIGTRMGAMILAEVGDFSRFDSPDKVLAYAGLSPSTYQSGQLTNCYAHMEKRGSRYLRFAIFNATKFVCLWDPTFSA